MSTVFSKSKEKRSRSSSNETNNSFVKNVTSRVTGLLPSTITKWFSGPSTSSANGSAPTADATDSSTEDEASGSPITTQPPSKRMKFRSPGKYNLFPTDVSCVTTNVDNFEQCAPYNNSAVQSPPGRTTFRRETNFVSTPIRTPTVESPVDKSDRDDTIMKLQHNFSNVGPSIASKRKSIFETSSNESSKRNCAKTASNTVVDPKAPYFKPGLLGSPFYPGQTMYGGASSTYINQPNIKHRKVALVNESNSSDNTSMSYSARRVMDMLENYSSPLAEAKRISQYINSSKNDSKITSGSPYSPKVLSYKTQELHVPNIASVLRLKQRSRLMDTTNAARQIIASHSSTTDYANKTPLNTERDQSDKETSNKFTTKVKSRLTRPKRGERDDIEMAPPVNLPTAVLQIDKNNMPKFSFETTSSLSTSVSNNTTTISSATPKFNFTSTPKGKPVSESITKIDAALTKPVLSKPQLPKPETVTCVDSYKFSSPVRLSSKALPTALPTVSTPPKFKFGSPDRGVDKTITVKKNDDDSSYVVGAPKETEKLSVPNTKDWQCPDCWVSNKTNVNKCVCCGCIKPSESAPKSSKCSICKLASSQSHIDKCVRCEKVQINNTMKAPAVPNTEASSKWKCDDCWVTNDENVEKCVCCGGKNPKKAIATQNKPTVVNSVNSATAADCSEWKCDDCWIKNKSNVDKCVACGGMKPGAKPTSGLTNPTNTSAMLPSLDSSLKDIVKSQSDTWECPICLVKNESNRSKCVCCEGDKPGAVKESALKMFNFGTTPNTFKFGIEPKVQENNIVKPTEEKPAEVPKKPEESETNNNTLPKTPSFSFGLPSKKDQLLDQKQVEFSKSTSNETPKLTFGLPITQASAETAVTPIFGSTNKLSENTAKKTAEEDEKLQEVPKVEFALPAPKEAPKPLTGIFGTQLTSPIASDKPLAPMPSLLGTSTTAEKKETPNNSALTIQSTVTSIQETKAHNSVTFTAPAIKPAVNLFASPTSTITPFAAPTSTPATTTMSLFQKPEMITTAGKSLFQKPDITTTSTVSLFQKSDTTATASPPSLAATAPIFSFGNNATPAAAPQPEKPKFNFTFGSNSSMFNNTFGSPSTDNNTNANKFGLTTNRLGTGGNGLAGSNTLAGGNGLTANKLGNTNDLSTNSLAPRNELQPATGLFGAPVQKENLWSSSSNNSTNLFVSNTSSTSLQKPAAFTFGSSTPFNASSPTPAFGSSAPPVQNIFGMNQNTSSQPTLFSTPVQSQPTGGLFSGAQPAAAATPSMGMFGATSVGATPTFGAPNPSVPSFETPSLTQAPAFNFGASQPTGVFGFGQQAATGTQAPSGGVGGVYSFGAAAAPQVQFNMGSAPSTGVRRVRKAVRRNPQR